MAQLRLVCISSSEVYELSPGGVLAVYMAMGGGGWGPTELHIANPKQYTGLKFYTQKIPGIKISNQKNTRLKYLNTDLFNYTDVKT